jgi:hypothetical protein
MDWFELAAGSFNTVYINAERTEIFKVQHSDGDISDAPERSVRLWNLINSEVYPDRPAKIHTVHMGGGELKTGWICPYIEGVQANDDEISATLLSIFNQTGRIIVDATAPKNFLRTPSGQIICVDIGLAIELERREEASRSLEHMSDGKPPRALTRKRSETSLSVWDEYKNTYNDCFFVSDLARIYPKTTSIIKALLYIKMQRPDIFNVDCLIGRPDLIALLVASYNQSQLPPAKANQVTIGDALQALDDCSSSAPLLDSPDAAGGGSSGAGEEREPDERAAHTAAPRDHGLSLFAPTPPPERMDKERDKTASLGLA